MHKEAAELAVAVAFAERLHADRARGTFRTADEYAVAFPGFERVVAEEFARLTGDPTAVEIAITTGPFSASNGLFVAPKRVGPYRLERELGRGGQGSVHLAVDERLGRKVALKLLSGPWAASADSLRRFDQEARALAAIDHPGLCAIYETAVVDGAPFIAMRYVEGETLAARFARRTAPPDAAGIAAATALLEKVARAVHAAHEAGYLHRDLKPANVMIGPDDEPVVLDLGLARRVEQDGAGETATGDVLGTPAYMAPEQASGDVRAIDRRTDVWALGAIIYEAVAGVRPFQGATAAAVLDAVRNEAPSSARALNPRASADLEVVVSTALAKRPADRYASALDFAEDLRRVRVHEPIRARRISALGRLARWARRRPAVAALCAVLAALLPALAALGGWYVAKRPDVEAHERAMLAEGVEDRLTRAFWALRYDDFGFEGAVALFEQALALDPDNVEAVCGLARAELKSGRADLALGRLRVRAAAFGPEPLVLRTEAEALRRLGRATEALDIEKTLPPPRTAIECFFEGQREFEARRVSAEKGVEVAAADETSIAWFERAIERSRRFRPLYLEALAHAVGRTRDTARARRVAETALLLLSEPTASKIAGFALLCADPDAAVARFKSVDLDGSYSTLDYALAIAYLWAQRFDDADAAMRRYAAARPDDATAHTNVAVFASRRRDFAGAERAASRAVELRPDLSYAWRVLARSQLDLLRPPEQYLETLKRALRAVPDDPDTLVLFAECAADVGRRDEAAAAARTAVRLAPESPAAHAALGRALQNVDAAGSYRAFLEARRLRPGRALYAAMAAVGAAAANDGPAARAHADDAAAILKRDPEQGLSPQYAALLDRIRAAFPAPSSSRPSDDEDG
jgi:tetratricopeptide (TPR) repeat protein